MRAKSGISYEQQLISTDSIIIIIIHYIFELEIVIGVKLTFDTIYSDHRCIPITYVIHDTLIIIIIPYLRTIIT